jgi:hypothetical protein
MRAIERRDPAPARPWIRWLPVAPMATVALALVYADATIANAARAAAQHFYTEMPTGGGRLIYMGHWGFQYYMQQGRAEQFDLRGTTVGPGDILIVPDNNMRPLGIDIIYSHRYPIEFDVFPWASTWNYHSGAAYYSSTWGPFPYVFGPATTEKYAALLVDRFEILKDPRIEELERAQRDNP